MLPCNEESSYNFGTTNINLIRTQYFYFFLSQVCKTSHDQRVDRRNRKIYQTTDFEDIVHRSHITFRPVTHDRI